MIAYLKDLIPFVCITVFFLIANSFYDSFVGVGVIVVNILAIISCVVYWLNHFLDQKRTRSDISLLIIIALYYPHLIGLSLSNYVRIIFDLRPINAIVGPSISSWFDSPIPTLLGLLTFFTVIYESLSFYQVFSVDFSLVSAFTYLLGGAFGLGCLVSITRVLQAISGKVDPPLSTLPAARVVMFWAITLWPLLGVLASLWLYDKLVKARTTNGFEKYAIFSGYVLILMGIFYLKYTYADYYTQAGGFNLAVDIARISYLTFIPVSLSVILNNKIERNQLTSIAAAGTLLLVGLTVLYQLGGAWKFLSPILDLLGGSTNSVQIVTVSSLTSIAFALVSDWRLKFQSRKVGKETIGERGLSFGSMSVNVQKGEIIMGDQKTEVILGNNVIIQGDLVVANSIRDSFNKATTANVTEDMRQLLRELSAAVGKMSEAMPVEEGRRAARALEILIAEASSSKPDKQWWQVSVDGLTKAAKNIGGIGKPVLDIVTRLVPFLIQKTN